MAKWLASKYGAESKLAREHGHATRATDVQFLGERTREEIVNEQLEKGRETATDLN